MARYTFPGQPDNSSNLTEEIPQALTVLFPLQYSTLLQDNHACPAKLPDGIPAGGDTHISSPRNDRYMHIHINVLPDQYLQKTESTLSPPA